MENKPGQLVNQAEILDNLLSESVVEAALRAETAFDKLAGDKKIVLIGSGNLGLKILGTFRKYNQEPLAFTDNNHQKWNTTVSGIAVLPPADAVAKYGKEAIFVVCIWSPGHHFKETKNQFLELGCNLVITCAFLFWKYPADLLPHYHFDLPQNYIKQKAAIKEAFALLTDSKSRNQYLAHLRARVFLDLEGLPFPTGEKQYFAKDIFLNNPDEVFLDGGAFTGDTLKDFLALNNSAFKNYLALEPDPENFKLLSEYTSKLDTAISGKINLFEYALGDNREILRFEPTGSAGAFLSQSGSLEVKCVTIDDEFNDYSPTFIKLDIEGAERFALTGGQNLIKNMAPLLAVCIYHMPDCLWHILLSLHQLNKDYAFFCRTYEGDGLDFVLYAVPPDRLLHKNI